MMRTALKVSSSAQRELKNKLLFFVVAVELFLNRCGNDRLNPCDGLQAVNLGDKRLYPLAL